MNDRSDHRPEPQWPSGADPDEGTPQPGGTVERTGFWSPLWEEDEQPPNGAQPREADAPKNGAPAAQRDAGAPGSGPRNGVPGGAGHGAPAGQPNGAPKIVSQSTGAPQNGGPQGNPQGAAPMNGGQRAGAPQNGPGRVPMPAQRPAGAPGRAQGGAPMLGGLGAAGFAAGQGPGQGGPAGAGGQAGPNGGFGGPNGNAGGPGGPNGNVGGPGGGPRGPQAGGPQDVTMAMGGPSSQETVAMPQGGLRPPQVPPGPPGRPGQPGQPGIGDAPTVFFPQNPGQPRGEPQLLTHREPDYEDDHAAEDDDYSEAAAAPVSDEQRKRLRRKKIWRRVRRTAYVCTALAIIIPVLAFFITYQMVEVESPEQVAAQQDKVVTLAWADGSEMAKLAKSGGNRIMLTPNQIPEHVRHAVYAAEDSTFETNSGFDLTGILRAAWNNVSGGGGGGSTISQQYIKKSSGDEDKTLTRKWVEIVKSYKMNETYSKDEIITAYLNTIYFGRGAYGIAAAAKAYYNVDDLNNLTKSQAALLAGMIQTPSRHKDEAYQQQRWGYVVGRMVELGWMTQAERSAQPFVKPIPLADTKPSTLPGPLTQIDDLVYDELKNVGITEEMIKRNGFKITLTIDKVAQRTAETAVGEIMKGQPANLHPGLVAVDPKTGHILAYYPSADGVSFDYAATAQEPGSSFKPFDLVGLLKKGKGIYETYDSANKPFPPKSAHIVRNASKPTCGECTVAQAMKESLNVVFSDMVYNDVKPGGVAEAAKEAGVLSPLDKASGDINIAIGGGATQVTTTDMASAYATFAANGIYRKPHLVSKIERPDGSVFFEEGREASYQEKPAFDEDAGKSAKIARNVTETLLPIPAYSHVECANGRLCAGKTGTHQYGETKDNAKAWMVGYTPQVSAAVSMSGDQQEPRLKNAKGDIIYGSGLPGKIWQKFMNDYHRTVYPKAMENFGKFVAIGKAEQKPTSSVSVPPSTTDTPPPTTTENPDPSNPDPTKPTKTTDPDPTTTTGKPTKPTRPTTTPVIPIP